MVGSLKSMMFILPFVGILPQTTAAYEIPQRKIILKPFINIMSPHKLMDGDYSRSAVENKMGAGFGAKARIQIAGSWGFVTNVSINDLQVVDSSLSTATVFTGGFGYTQATAAGDISVDLGYGVISVADFSATLILPSIELSMPVSERFSISAEMGFPVANDWFHSFGIKESFGSFVLSLGGAVVF